MEEAQRRLGADAPGRVKEERQSINQVIRSVRKRFSPIVSPDRDYCAAHPTTRERYAMAVEPMALIEDGERFFDASQHPQQVAASPLVEPDGPHHEPDRVGKPLPAEHVLRVEHHPVALERVPHNDQSQVGLCAFALH